MTEPATRQETTTETRLTNAGQQVDRVDAGSQAPVGWRVALAQHVSCLSIPFESLVKALHIMESAIPVGLLQRTEIEQLVRRNYAAAPDFYDPRKYRIRYEEQLLPILERHIGKPAGHRLLDLCCGHGREAEIFARAGFKVYGVDSQEAVIARAQAYAEHVGFQAEFTAADIETWVPPQADWDIVYTSLWMYSTVPDRAARKQWLGRLSDWVASSGCLVISVTPQSGGAGPAVRHAIAWLTRLLSLNSRRPELGDRFHNGLFWHDFTDRTLVAELDDAGMEIIDSLEIGGGTPCHFYLLRPRTGRD